MPKPTIEQNALRQRDDAARSDRPGNLLPLLSRRWRLGRTVAALLAGTVLAGAYAPLDWGWLVWFALVPLLWLGIPSTTSQDWQGRQRTARGWWLETPPCPRAAWLGYAYGFAFFTVTFFWIRVAFPPASWLFPPLLGLYMAFYPAVWLWLAACLYRNLSRNRTDDLAPAIDPRSVPRAVLRWRDEWLWTFLMAAAWTALEWLRSWLITGLPWNLLGVSQWHNGWLLPLTRFTGVYGISFLVVTVNLGLFLAIRRTWLHLRHRWLQATPDESQGPRPGLSFTLVPRTLIAALTLVALAGSARLAYRLPPPARTFRVAAVQGNLPQMRVFTEAQLFEAMDVYWTLTEDVILTRHPDVVVWPETAIPAAMRVDLRTRAPFFQLLTEMKTPMMVGLFDLRVNPQRPDDYMEYNSVVCFRADGSTVASYDKQHRVMFGEYTPLEDWFPWLVDLIGMGRSLEKGHTSTIYEPQPDVRIGFGICIEDIFPSVSRDAVLHHANVLVVVTNDAWYGETAGTTQHTAHAIFRAVETLRPLVRNGNNSDTMLIMPDGSVVNHLHDPDTGSVFTRQAGVYDVPIWPDPPVTIYTRYGDWFAELCSLITVAALAWCGYRAMDRRRRLFDAASAPISDHAVD